MQSEKKAKRLNFLWWFTYISVSNVVGYIKYSAIQESGSYPWEPFSNPFQFFFVLLMGLFFLPLKILVGRYAKAAKIVKLQRECTLIVFIMTVLLVGVILFPEYVS